MRIGPYETVRELGRGGMGVVYEVRHPDVPAPLALKLMDAREAGVEAVLRFEREARLLARVRHPNVLVVHALGRTDEGHLYLVTDLVEGRTLHALRKEGPLPWTRAAEIVRDLARAVAAVHREGILHRDLKSENVMMRKDGTPVLLDFGLARELGGEALTRSGLVVGTPGTMSPEQASAEGSRVLDERTDVYGLGAVLFELLAGRPPFEGAGLHDVVFAVLEKAPRWPSEDDASVPRGLEAACRHALEKSPGARPATADAFADEVDAWLCGEDRGAGSRVALAVAALLALAVLPAVAVGVLRAPPPAPVPAAAPPPPPPPPAPPPPPPPPPPPSGPPRDPRTVPFLKALEARDANALDEQRARLAIATELGKRRADATPQASHLTWVDDQRAVMLVEEEERLWVGDPLGLDKLHELKLPEVARDVALVPGRPNLLVLATDTALYNLGVVPGRIRLGRAGAWAELPSAAPNKADTVIAVSPDGKLVAAAGNFRHVVIHELGRARRSYGLYHDAPVHQLAFDPKGEALLFAAGTTVDVGDDRPNNGLFRWRFAAGEAKAARLPSLSFRSTCVAVRQDGLVATGDSAGGVRLVPAEAPDLEAAARSLVDPSLPTPRAHEFGVTALCWGPRGECLYTCDAPSAAGGRKTNSGVLRVWFPDRPAPLARLLRGHGLATLAVAPAGAFLGAGTWLGQVHLLAAGDELAPPRAR